MTYNVLMRTLNPTHSLTHPFSAVYSAPTVCNSLPANVRSCVTLSTFHRGLKPRGVVRIPTVPIPTVLSSYSRIAGLGWEPGYTVSYVSREDKRYTTYECIPELVVTVPSARSTIVKKIKRFIICLYIYEVVSLLQNCSVQL